MGTEKCVCLDCLSAVKPLLTLAMWTTRIKRRNRQHYGRRRKPFLGYQAGILRGTYLEFPVMINGKSKRIHISTSATERQLELFNNKLGTMRIVVKGEKFVDQITYQIPDAVEAPGNKAMGVDLGILCPAVVSTSDGKVKFIGNGRKNRYLRRFHNSRRQKLQKKGHLKSVKNSRNKESRQMRDINHKISRSTVDFAVREQVSVIKMEHLKNIRSTTRTSRKNAKNIHRWPFYQLQSMIEYKAAKAGIRVEYVNPAYTSQSCPCCGQKHKTKGRQYICGCGFRLHRDIVGAHNICKAEIV